MNYQTQKIWNITGDHILGQVVQNLDSLESIRLRYHSREFLYQVTL